eukprot:UN23395
MLNEKGGEHDSRRRKTRKNEEGYNGTRTKRKGESVVLDEYETRDDRRRKKRKKDKCSGNNRPNKKHKGRNSRVRFIDEIKSLLKTNQSKGMRWHICTTKFYRNLENRYPELAGEFEQIIIETKDIFRQNLKGKSEILICWEPDYKKRLQIISHDMLIDLRKVDRVKRTVYFDIQSNRYEYVYPQFNNDDINNCLFRNEQWTAEKIDNNIIRITLDKTKITDQNYENGRGQINNANPTKKQLHRP